MNYENISKEELINENKMLRFQLNEVEKKYKLFADNVSDVIWIFDFINERFTFVSPSIEHMSGQNPEKALALKWDDIVVPEEREKFSRFMTDILSSIKMKKFLRDKPFKLETGHRHCSGATVWVELKARFLFNENGKPYLILGVSRDITDRRRAEEKLRQAHAFLEEMVEQRTAHLNEANIALTVLLEKREKDKKEMEEKVALNLRDLVLPILDKLKQTCKKDRQQAYIDILDANINGIISPLIRGLSLMHVKLSPTEIQVANLVARGKSNKEIAGLSNLSLRTIEFHRRNIRTKVGIKNKKINLRTYLLSIC